MLDLSLSISPEPHLEQQQQQQQQPPPRRDADDHWTNHQKRNLKRALSEFSTDIPNFFEKIASKVPGKSIQQVQKYFESCYKLDGNMHVLVNEDDDLVLPPMLPGKYASDRKRPCYWTQNEHELFLMGVAKHGMGMWKQIAENYVRSKTAFQVLVHAQNSFSGADKKCLRTIDLFKNTDGRTITATVTTTVATNNYDASSSKCKVSDGHDGDGDDDDDNDDDDDLVIVLDDSAPDLPRVPQTLNLFPLTTLASSSQKEEEGEEKLEEEEEEKGYTLNLFPTHPTYM